MDLQAVVVVGGVGQSGVEEEGCGVPGLLLPPLKLTLESAGNSSKLPIRLGYWPAEHQIRYHGLRLCVRACVYVCVCVCVWEREREQVCGCVCARACMRIQEEREKLGAGKHKKRKKNLINVVDGAKDVDPDRSSEMSAP
jgi:hypothetical protein